MAPSLMDARTIQEEVERVYTLCREQPGKPVVLEALWDGDTTGWMLDLWLTTEPSGLRGLLGRNERRRVVTLRYGSDIRVFSGSVPPWPESLVATRVGERLFEECGCVLWFPSPHAPDDDCPRYVERDRAFCCADCSKLILPRTSAHLPKDICYPCHIERERKAKLARAPTDSTRQRGTWFQIEGRADGKPTFRTWFTSATSESPMREVLQRLFPDLDAERDAELEATDTANLRAPIVALLEQRLADYEPPASRWHRAPSKTVLWNKREYVLSLQFSQEHRRISHLLEIVTALDTENPVLRVFTNVGLAYRDTSILAHIRSAGGTLPRAAVVEYWSDVFGSPEAVGESLARLLATNCMEEEASGVLALTRKGRLVDLSEEGG